MAFLAYRSVCRFGQCKGRNLFWNFQILAYLCDIPSEGVDIAHYNPSFVGVVRKGFPLDPNVEKNMKTSIHIKPVKKGSEQHNNREKNLSYVRSDLSSMNEHYSICSITDRLADIKERYHRTTGQRMQAKATPIREGCVVISPSTTMADLQRFCQRCQDEYGIQAIQIHIHRDEGHIKAAQNGTWKPNLHAHIVFDWTDKRGKSIKIDRQDMARMQTILAESLHMERGESSDRQHLDVMQFKTAQLAKDVRELQQVKTGFLAKIQDSWKWKGRAKQREADLEAERKAHKEDIAKANKTLAETKKMAENERIRAVRAENSHSNLREENEKLYKENRRLNMVAKHWKDKYDETIGKQIGQDNTKRGRGW